MAVCVRSVNLDGGSILRAGRATSVGEKFVSVESGIVGLGKGSMVVLVPPLASRAGALANSLASIRGLVVADEEIVCLAWDAAGGKSGAGGAGVG